MQEAPWPGHEKALSHHPTFHVDDVHELCAVHAPAYTKGRQHAAPAWQVCSKALSRQPGRP